MEPKIKVYGQLDLQKQRARDVLYVECNERGHIAPQCSDKTHLIIRSNYDISLIRRIKSQQGCARKSEEEEEYLGLASFQGHE